MIKFRFFSTGTSLLQLEPYQKAIPDKRNAVVEIGQKTGALKSAILKIRSNMEIIGNAYCKIKK